MDASLPRGWRWAQLRDVAVISAGQSPPSSTYRSTAAGLPFFQGKADFGEHHPTPRTWCVEPKIIAEPGDILISVRAPVGPTNVADVRCCIGRGLAAVRAKEDNEPDYILAALKLNEPKLASFGAGSTFAAINKRQLETLRIPVAPPAEQRRIAGVLSGQVTIVANVRKNLQVQLEEASRLRRSLLREAFEGITPLAISNTRDAPPSGWSWTPLQQLARLESGHTPSRRRPDWWGGTIPWIALPDIRALDGRTATETIEYTNAEGIANSSARVLPAGTVVLSRTASVGFVTIMGHPMATSQDFVNWVCGPRLHPEFLMYLFQAAREKILEWASGTVHKTVYMPTVRIFQVCIPELEEQKRIASVLRARFEKLDELLALLNNQKNRLLLLPSALLREAFP